ncbi:MAG: diphosphomevalonate decarboxylase, partial [Myxococcota bacterium]
RNLPSVGSLSMTLSDLRTRTEVIRDEALENDSIFLGDSPAPIAFANRASRFLDLIRELAGVEDALRVTTENNFPTGAGLASSASGFAALALAASRAFELELSPSALSRIARVGSGSASRSLFGGFVEWHRGVEEDGSDSFAEPIAPEDHWDVRMLVVITSDAEKTHSSTDGMNLTKETSPYFDAWVDGSARGLEAMRDAVLARDLTRVGELMEASCLQMHAVMMSATPGLLYWNAATVELIHAVRQLRGEGVEAYFTIDAGPQVKILCKPSDAPTLARRLQTLNGVQRILEASVGPAAYLEAT